MYAGLPKIYEKIGVKEMLKILVITFLVLNLNACGTMSGAISGLGKDITSIGEMIGNEKN